MNVDSPLLHHHPVDHRTDQALSSLEGRRGEGAADALGKARQARLEIGPLKSRGVLMAQRLQAGLQVRPLPAEQVLAVCELIERDEPGLIGIQEPVLLTVGVGELLGQRPRLLGDQVIWAWHRLRAQLRVGLEDEGRTLEVAPNLRPHETIEFIGANVPLGTPPDAPPCAQHVVPGTVVVVVEGPVSTAHPMAGGREIADPAPDESPQQVVPRLQVARTEPAVVGVERLGPPEAILADERRHAQRDPLRGGTRAGVALMPAPTGGRLRVALEGFVPVEVHRADVGLVLHQPAHRAGSPAGEAGGAGMRGLGQTERDLPNAQALVDVPGEDLPHDLRFRFTDLDVGGDAVLARDPAIAVGHLPENHLALPRPKELPAPVALGDFHPFVFRDDPLDLDQEARMGILARGLLEEDDPSAEALELLQDEDLVGVLAGQTVRAEHQHRLKRPGHRPIPEPIQAGAIQAGAAVAVIDTDIGLDDLMPLLLGIPA